MSKMDLAIKLLAGISIPIILLYPLFLDSVSSTMFEIRITLIVAFGYLSLLAFLITRSITTAILTPKPLENAILLAIQHHIEALQHQHQQQEPSSVSSPSLSSSPSFTFAATSTSRKNSRLGGTSSTSLSSKANKANNISSNNKNNDGNSSSSSWFSSMPFLSSTNAHLSSIQQEQESFNAKQSHLSPSQVAATVSAASSIVMTSITQSLLKKNKPTSNNNTNTNTNIANNTGTLKNRSNSSKYSSNFEQISEKRMTTKKSEDSASLSSLDGSGNVSGPETDTATTDNTSNRNPHDSSNEDQATKRQRSFAIIESDSTKVESGDSTSSSSSSSSSTSVSEEQSIIPTDNTSTPVLSTSTPPTPPTSASASFITTSATETNTTEEPCERKASRGKSISTRATKLDVVCASNYARAIEDISLDREWKLVHTEGVMNVYRKDILDGDRVLDLSKAYHTIEGLTAGEVAHFFWSFDCRKEWETTLDQTKIIETIDNTTLVIHNVFKRIWPSTARETLIIDHMRPITSLHGATESSPNSDGARFAGPGWIVVSFSTDHSSVPKQPEKLVRATCNVSMICRTRILNNHNGSAPLTRSNVACDLIYMANVDPGGYVPSSLTRAVSKREYPKFLTIFDAYCKAKVKGTEIDVKSL